MLYWKLKTNKNQLENKKEKKIQNYNVIKWNKAKSRNKNIKQIVILVVGKLTLSNTKGHVITVKPGIMALQLITLTTLSTTVSGTRFTEPEGGMAGRPGCWIN